MPKASPIMGRGGPVPGASEMAKTAPSLGPLGFNEGPGMTVPKTMPPGLSMGLPPGFAMGEGAPSPEAPPVAPGGADMMGLMPPGWPMGLGNAPAPAPPQGQIDANAGGGFGQQARGLFGGPGKTLYDILADAMAGAAAVDPTAPGIKAFGQGFTGARLSKKVREKEGTDAEDKAYEREGTDLDRDVKRETFKMDKRKWNLDSIMKLIEIAQARAGGDPNKFRQELIKLSATSPLGVMDAADLNRAMGMAFPGQNQGNADQGGQKWSPDSGTPPPTGHKRYDKSGRTIMWDGTQWVDEQGVPVPTS